MTIGAKKNSLSTEPTGSAPGRFRSVLVPVDLTPLSDRVLARVARLPLANDARLQLLHVVPSRLPPREQRSAERDAKNALAGEARNLAKSLPKTIRLEPVVKVGAAAIDIAACASSMNAELIVMGRGGGRALRDIFLGSTAERVIRRGQLPVLVVRMAAREAYSRPALALDLDQAAHDVLSLMFRIIVPPRPRLTVIHAFDSSYGRLVYPSLPEDVVEERRSELQQTASLQLGNLLADALARAGLSPKDAPWKSHVRDGSPRLVIAKAVKKAETDLLALGTHGYSGLAHMFLGTVAGDVLRDVTCDVLVVPPRPAATENT